MLLALSKPPSGSKDSVVHTVSSCAWKLTTVLLGMW